MRGPAQSVLIVCTALWCLAILAVPLFNAAPLALFFSVICHQIPARSWHLLGEPLGLCIRCTSISLGFFCGLLLVRMPHVRWFKLAIVINLVEWLLALTVIDSETLRALSGLMLGAVAAPIIRAGVKEMFIRVRTAHESM